MFQGDMDSDDEEEEVSEVDLLQVISKFPLKTFRYVIASNFHKIIMGDGFEFYTALVLNLHCNIVLCMKLAWQL